GQLEAVAFQVLCTGSGGRTLDGGDLAQGRIVEPLRLVKRPHQCGHAAVGFGHALYGDGGLVGRDVVEIDTVRKRAHQLVEKPYDHRSHALEVLDDFHARGEFALLLLQFAYLGNFAIENLDLLGEVLVTRGLVVDHADKDAIRGEDQYGGQTDGNGERHQELLLALLAFPLTPGQKVDIGHQLNPRKARPQASMRDAASFFSCPLLTLLPI